jgi:hypothetical protein
MLTQLLIKRCKHVRFLKKLAAKSKLAKNVFTECQWQFVVTCVVVVVIVVIVVLGLLVVVT